LSENFWKNKKILITGHTGFVGSWLCMVLNIKGAKIYGISRGLKKNQKNLYNAAGIDRFVKSFKCDLNDFKKTLKIVKLVKPNICFHLAAESKVVNSEKNSHNTLQNNFNSTLNILESVRLNKSVKNLIFFLTAYNGKKKFSHNIESYEFNNNLYTISKIATDNIIDAYYRNYLHRDLSLTKIFPPNILGGGDLEKTSLLSSAINTWNKNKKFTVHNPNNNKSWCYILDLIDENLSLISKLYKNNTKEINSTAFDSVNNVCSVKKIINLAKKNYHKKGKVFLSKNQTINKNPTINIYKKKQKLYKLHNTVDINNAVKNSLYWYKIYNKKANILAICESEIKNYYIKKA